MPTFAYKAATSIGKVVEGSRAAPSREALVEHLHKDGLIPIRIGAADARAPEFSRLRFTGGGITRAQLGLMMDQLAALVGAGLTVERALTLLARGTKQTQLSAALGRMQQQLRSGAPLSRAAGEALPQLGRSAVSLIEAGEASGNLAGALEQISASIAQGLALQRNLVSALIYPAILLATSIGAIVFMLTFVVPQFKATFAEAGATLPFATRLLIGAGDAFAQFGPLLLMCAAAAAVLLWRWRLTPSGRSASDAALLRVPLLGQILLRYELAQFGRTLGALLSARIPLVRALKLAQAGIHNAAIAERIRAASERTRDGESLGAALRANGPWPSDAIEMIAMGEESGRLSAMLTHLAKIYDEALKRDTERAMTILTPALTLLMAGFVAAIIGAILSAILGTYDLPL